MKRGDLLGRVRPGSPARLQVLDEAGGNIGLRLFDYQRGDITLTQSLMPALLTRE